MSIAAVVAGVLRTMPVAAPIALGGVAAAHGQPTEPLRLEAGIPAQPLAAALEAFARQTGLQLVYVSDVVGNHRSSAAAAGLAPREALVRLLRGTGLRFEFLTPNTVRIIDARPASRPIPPIAGGAVADEVIVTASRREESAQTVPITIQVLSSATLVRLGVSTFDDLVLQVPGMTARGVGPSQNTICMRGLCTSEFANQSAGVNSSFPNVAVYLDEQPAQLPGRNLDIYAADLERIEILEGPQGTLFGAGAQAGVLRYITNKPKIDVTEFVTTAGYALTTHGAPSRSLDAALNVPLVAGTLAVRTVVYNERRGGYIDNIPATFARSQGDPSLYFAYSGGQVPANSVTLDNFHLAAHDINPVTYKGARVQALYEINDDWSALLGQSYQRMDADGVFAEMAADALGHPQPDLTVQSFNPSHDSDRFENTALTVDGRIGSLRLLYAGAYLVRNVEQVQDYTSYAHAGHYIDYYQCINPSPGDPATAQCFSPSSTWREVERNTHQSHEVRVRTAEDRRIRGIGGLFYEDYRIQDRADWFYVTALPYFQPVGPPTGYYVLNGQIVCGCSLSPGAVFVPKPPTSNDPSPRPLGDGFFNDVTRGYQQKAAYASIDVDLVPGALTVTAGTRYLRLMNHEVGSYGGSFGCQLLNDPLAPNPCLNRYAVNLDALALKSTNSGFRSRASVRWTPRDGAMLYYTWSQGLRTGGFNRSGGTPGASPLYPGTGTWQAQAYAHGGWAAPRAWTPDGLVNN